MSPIYIRPAREQAEHDRLITFLEAQHEKKFEVLVNKGESRDFALKVGTATYFPDLILQQAKKPAGVIEIETGESTNNLEALAQWVHFGRSKVPFFLYVPVLMFDAARRFCEMHQVAVSEIWTYRPVFDGFDLVRELHDPQAVSKAGKGPMGKVVTMPKTAEAPKPQPAIEAVEEILARIGSREAARQASREAARQASRARAAKPTKTAAAPAPRQTSASAPVPPPSVPVKAAAPGKAAEATPRTPARAASAAAKPVAPARAPQKPAAAPAAKRKPVAAAGRAGSGKAASSKSPKSPKGPKGRKGPVSTVRKPAQRAAARKPASVKKAAPKAGPKKAAPKPKPKKTPKTKR